MADMDYGLAARLVKKAQNGDSDAFAELYTMTYQIQYAKARRYLRDDFLAQDALQEMYILALRNLHRLEQPKAFGAWLGQINFRVCYNMVSRRKQEHSIDEMEEYSPLESRDASPEEQSIAKSQRNSLWKAMEQLSQEDQQILTLRFGQDKKLTEISELTGMSLSSVKRHIQRACDSLEKIMEGR